MRFIHGNGGWGRRRRGHCALLHDTLEDHPEQITYESIAARFRQTVADIVRGCTDTPVDFFGGEKPPWKNHKEAYLEHLRDSPEYLLRVALADKLHNARDICNDLNAEGELTGAIMIWKK